MWLLDALAAGFRHPTDEARLQYFRIVLGLALTVRFLLSLDHSGWNRFAPGTYSTFALTKRIGEQRFHRLARAYKPVLAARPVAALALATGVLPRLSALLVIAALAFELTYAKSPNTLRFAILMTGTLVLAGALGTGLPEHRMSTHNTWAQALCVLVTTDLYWGSAWSKARSAQFRSGLYLAQWVHVFTQVKDRLPRGEHFIPGVVRRHLGTLSERSVRAWRLVAVTVIALEVLLPPALLIERTRTAAIVVGIAMHVGFSCLKPRQLIAFSSITLAGYILFAAT
ncbi:hypothetical protein ACFP3U_04830 [Kitasatospora misakiensis]|uniref:HTTM domain-containing protein n=1 Tax=Kitasatospora misakiensis TaxID=67330 RepID=A0ABW0WVI9_9ACTN